MISKSEQREQKLREKYNKDNEERENKRKKHLDNLLFEAMSSFREYREGYKVYTLLGQRDENDRINDNILTDFINEISEEYKCDCLGVSTTESMMVPLKYTLLFKK